MFVKRTVRKRWSGGITMKLISEQSTCLLVHRQVSGEHVDRFSTGRQRRAGRSRAGCLQAAGCEFRPETDDAHSAHDSDLR